MDVSVLMIKECSRAELMIFTPNYELLRLMVGAVQCGSIAGEGDS